MKQVLATAALALALSACGGTDNQSACQNFESQIKCGNLDLSQSIDCSTYKSVSCDISAYWDCLTTNFKCVNNVPDTSAWGPCEAKATCS